MPFDPASGLAACRRKSGLLRAKFWRSTGWANLQLAWAARARNRALALEAAERKVFSPFAIEGDTPSLSLNSKSTRTRKRK
jgi:hypothetical protein